MTHRPNRLAAFALSLGTAIAATACVNDIEPHDSGQAVEEQSSALVSAPKVLASHQGAVADLALDATDAYWTTFGAEASTGTIVKVSKLGGTPITLATEQSVPIGIAVDETQVYWANYDSGGPHGALMAVAKSGGTPRALVSTPDGPRGVVVDASRAYFLTWNAVVGVPKHGGAPVTVTSTQCGNAIAADETSLYWVVNCVMFPPQGIFKVAKTGGEAVKISDEAPPKIAVERDGIYFMATGGTVMRLPKTGGIALPVAKFDVEWSAPLAVDAFAFYAGIDPSIVKRSRFGIWPRKLATSPAQIGTIAIDGTSVYWTTLDFEDGRILKISKY